MSVKTHIKISASCKRSPCPITNTLDVVGDKWTLLVIRDMLFLGKSQFGEFLSSPEGISTNILTDRLKKLEDLKVITKRSYQTNPIRYEYQVTHIGLELEPVLKEMLKWGITHIEGSQTPPQNTS